MRTLKLSLLLGLTLIFLAAPFARAQEWRYPETFYQYAPSVGTIAALHFGPEERLQDATIALALSSAAQLVIVNAVLKPLTSELRPDGSNYKSFPSGHTCTAFVGAEMVRHEFGPVWGGAAYVLAASVGAMRVVHERHWWWDTVAGAGIGILCTNLGYMMVDPVRNVLGLPHGGELSLVPALDPFSGSYGAGLRLVF